LRINAQNNPNREEIKTHNSKTQEAQVLNSALRRKFMIFSDIRSVFRYINPRPDLVTTARPEIHK